jgi:sugar phosphate isomerase/epimerase
MLLPVEVRKSEAAFRETFPRLLPLCNLAARLGCGTAILGILPSSELPKDEQAMLLRTRLRECARILEPFSIRLALECVTPLHLRAASPYGFIWHFDEMLDFALSIAPNAGLVVDSWHWHHGGADPDAFANIPGDHILDVHLADAPDLPPEAIRDTERLFPGEGIIDFGQFFELLKRRDYRHDIALEIFGRGISEMRPEAAARLAFEKTKSIFPA